VKFIRIYFIGTLDAFLKYWIPLAGLQNGEQKRKGAARRSQGMIPIEKSKKKEGDWHKIKK